MKTFVIALMTATMLVGPGAFAQGRDRDRNERRGEEHLSRGERLHPRYMSDRFIYANWRDAGLSRPQRGQSWRLIGDDYVLVSSRTRVIADIVPVRRYDNRDARRTSDRDERWRQRYRQTYTYNDDRAYTECRNQPDPAGVLAGAFLGAILGNAAGGRRDAAAGTVAGVIAGGALGAALTAKLDCSDRSYAYQTYSRGFNAGRANAQYEWRNPGNGHNGRFHVLDYYEDEDNFRCAVYSSTVYIDGRPEEARGRACQQPDGTWAMID